MGFPRLWIPLRGDSWSAILAMQGVLRKFPGPIYGSNLLSEATSHTCAIDRFGEQSWGLWGRRGGRCVRRWAWPIRTGRAGILRKTTAQALGRQQALQWLRGRTVGRSQDDSAELARRGFPKGPNFCSDLRGGPGGMPRRSFPTSPWEPTLPSPPPIPPLSRQPARRSQPASELPSPCHRAVAGLRPCQGDGFLRYESHSRAPIATPQPAQLQAKEPSGRARRPAILRIEKQGRLRRL